MTTATFRNYTGRAADLYQRFFVPTIAAPVSRALLDAVALQLGERVVDIACGSGVLTRAAAERVGPTGTVVGVDLSPDMIDVARDTPAAGAPIEWHTADAEALPLPDASCDVVLCQMGLMFMQNPSQALREACRILAPGGRLALNTPGAIQPRFAELEAAIVDNLDPKLGAFVSTVFSMSDPDQLSTLLVDAGFTDVRTDRYTVALDFPEPAEFLWNYVNLTPMGALVTDAPDGAKDAVERQVVESWTPHVVAGRVRVVQPMVLALGERS